MQKMERNDTSVVKVESGKAWDLLLPPSEMVFEASPGLQGGACQAKGAAVSVQGLLNHPLLLDPQPSPGCSSQALREQGSLGLTPP